MNNVDLLYAHLCEENRLLALFIETLEQEALLLSSLPDINDLKALTNKKNQQIELLLTADEKRQALLAQCGFDIGAQGLAQAADKHSFLSGPCAMLLEFSARANAINTENGTAISSYLAHHNEALHQIQLVNGEGGLYNAQGRRTVGKMRPR